MGRTISKRAIHVDGTDYRWGVSRSGTFVVWQADGRRTLGRDDAWRVSGDVPPCQRDQWDDERWQMPVTPGLAAAWIRVNLQGKAPEPLEAPTPQRKLAPRVTRVPVAVQASQPEAYVVVSEAGEYDDYGMGVVEVHLDPQVAKESARVRNAAQARRRELCRELHAPIFDEYDRLRAWRGRRRGGGGGRAARGGVLPAARHLGAR